MREKPGTLHPTPLTRAWDQIHRVRHRLHARLPFAALLAPSFPSRAAIQFFHSTNPTFTSILNFCRRSSYEQRMSQLELSEKEKEAKRRRLDRIESQYLRARRIRLTKDTFKTVQVIGRGSFGEVRLVFLGRLILCCIRILFLTSECLPCELCL